MLLGPAKSESRRLLGYDYRYWAAADDIERITGLIGELFDLWNEKPEDLVLQSEDLNLYLSPVHLKNELEKIGL